MLAGTGSFGLRHTKSHTLCRRCGRRSFHIQKSTCGSCGYPAAKIRKCECIGRPDGSAAGAAAWQAVGGSRDAKSPSDTAAWHLAKQWTAVARHMIEQIHWQMRNLMNQHEQTRVAGWFEAVKLQRGCLC